jgi:serine/threonine protein kinase
MGEIYKARDTRLDRTIAVKVLPSHVASNPDVRQRFEREALAVSSLNHPNICTLHDIGQQDGVDYLVMEYLEGETLTEKIEKGPLAADELLRCAIDVADALDKAHRSGLMHRDLKPGNIMITKSGTKLLDFGLAKSIGAAAAPSNLTASPTMTSPLTAEGTIVGTFQYMAPEQLEGKEADPRSDLFALGAVIYEMATGRRAFEGKTQASLIASILKDQPRPIMELRPMSPPALERIVRQCLAKDPDERWQSAGDLKRELRWIAEGGSQASAQTIASAAAAPHRMPAWLAWGAAILLAGGAIALGYSLRAPAQSPVMRTSLLLPAGTALDSQNTSIALSPDGTSLALIASTPDGPRQLWIRPMNSLTAQSLAGTEGATYPFWSPDGQHLGFFADRKLKKIPASGGTVVTLCDAEDGRGASWGSTGTIVFAPNAFGALMQIPSSGGAPVAVTTVDKDSLTHRLPHFLPGGKRLLFLSDSGTTGDSTNGIYSLDLDSKKTALVIKAEGEGLYAEPGFLVYVRDGNLMGQPFDTGTLRASGEAVPIAEKVSFNAFRFTGAYTLSSTGLLLFQTGAAVPKSQLTWFDLDGKKGATVGEPASFPGTGRLAFSPDGQRAAVAVQAGEGKIDIWIYDLARAVGSRFTFGPKPAFSPLWSPDGGHVVYTEGPSMISIKAADGTSDARALISSEGGSRTIPLSFSPDGSHLAYRVQSGKTRWDIWMMPLKGDRKPFPFIATPAAETNAEFSPDGKWVAYISDESGKDELFVVPFPGPGGKWQISSGGASSGWWIGDGHEIAYVTPARKLIGVQVALKGSNLEIEASRPLFGGQTLPTGARRLAPDGRRYLALVPLDEAVTPPLTLVTNWSAELATK